MSEEESTKTPNDWIMSDYSSTFQTSASNKIDHKNFNEYDNLTSSSVDLGFDGKFDLEIVDLIYI